MKQCLYFLILSTVVYSSAAPTIIEIKWGSSTVSDAKRSYKDCKLSPNGSRAWDWNETGTRHVHGIQIADLGEFIDDVDVVILSKGFDGVLQTMSETEEYLKQKGKEYHLLLSEEAAELYNDLVGQKKRVGALIHSTC
jgi:hypothetical protein